MAEMEYTINLEKGIIHCEFTGALCADDLIGFISTIRSDPDFHKKLNTISDIRKAKITKGFLEMHTLSEFIKNSSSERGHFKWAFLTGDENRESAVLFKALTSDKLVKCFFSSEEAEAWVTS